MLVTKWKNSSPKAKSVTVMLVILLSLTLCLMAFLPFFQTRAASEFSTPLTEMSFIEQLYQSNYIQYKYLKEKTDQKNWSYSDLYLTIDYLGNRESGDPAFSASSATYQIADRISSDASSDTPVSDGDLEEALYNVFLSQIDEMKAGAEKLTQYVDYCAQDTAPGTQIGNSSVSELTALLNGQTSTEHPSYIYYAVIEYDAAGHVSSCRAYFGDESDSFLKKLETAGREQYFQQFSDDSDSLLLDFDSDSGQTYRYRVSLSGPSNMRIIYAITQQQYQKILSSRDLFMSDTNYDSLQYQSYCTAGVPHVLIGFFAAAFLFGGFMVLLFEKRGYCIRSFSICQLPIEIAAVLLCLFFQGPYFLTHLICGVQQGQLFPNLTKHVLSPLHLSGTLYLFLAIVFFLCFFVAFLLGTIAAGCLRSKQEFREHSLIIRYWRRIMNAWNRFYQELVSFDIGTDAKKMISKLVIVNFIILFVITFFWVWGFVPLLIYSLIIYFLLKKYVYDIQTKYQNLLRATSSIARGDFDTAFSEDFGVFESYKKELLQIQTDFKKAVEEEVKSQRMKSELITNVSHDLKTPLTAIITYINLLKEPGLTQKQQQEYLDTLDKKALRLKVLIEDLFEISKATTNNVTLHYDNVDICNLLRQCYLEYEARMQEKNLTFKFQLPEEKVILRLDPQKTFRIFDNLYTNISKYAMPSTRVYVTVTDSASETQIAIRNISQMELTVSGEELTERFVRGDGSRNTEGSGLGLAIARSFTELQHGTMQILLDGDLFKAILTFRKPGAEPNDNRSEHLDTAHSANANLSGNLNCPGAADNPAEGIEPPPIYRPSRWRSDKNLRKHGQKK